MGRRRIALFVAPVVGAAVSLAPVVARAADPAVEVPPTWSASVDGGRLGDDITQFAETNGSTMVGKIDSVYLAGSTTKPPPASGLLSDRDVFVSAVVAESGARRWSTTIDTDGADDALGGFEVNRHNNSAYAPVNAAGSTAVHDIDVSRDPLVGGPAVTKVWTRAGATANDTAITYSGGYLGLVGRAGTNFWVGSLMTGGWTSRVDHVGVPGVAMAADIAPTDTAPLYVNRTMIVTGQRSGFGTGGDMYTAAFDATGAKSSAPLWEHTWASADNRADIGLAAEAAWVPSIGRGVGFVAGRTYSPARGFDIVLDAFDLENGTRLWASAPVVINGPLGSGDDEVVDIEYSAASNTLYVLANVERGVPYGRDVAVFAIDATSGSVRRAAYASGDAANGDDTARSLVVAADGRRVYVAAEAVNVYANGGRRAALFAFDSELRPARRAFGAGDRAAAVVVTRSGLAADFAFLAGSARASAGYDAAVSAFDRSAFASAAVATVVTTLPDSATSAEVTDSATVGARLTEADGTPIANAPVDIHLGESTITASTDAWGVARATFRIDGMAGTRDLSFVFAGRAGDPPLLASSISATFEVVRETTSLTLSRTGNGPTSAAVARLADSDSPATGIEGRTVSFYGDGRLIGTATTGADGVASIALPGPYRNAKTVLTAAFAGDGMFASSTARAA